MGSESFPKEFEKTTEVLPFTKYGLTSMQEYKEAEKDIHHLEWLKKAGLTYDEINLLKENEAGLLGQRKKMESNAMKEKLEVIYSKINKLSNDVESSDEEDEQPSTSNETSEKNIDKGQLPLTSYPDGHPMHKIKDIEENLFRHLKTDDMSPVNKRRKILRRLERKKERILALENQINIGIMPNTSKGERPGSLWDVKELPRKQPKANPQDRPVSGPKKPTMYTVKDEKIVRLEPINEAVRQDEYRAVDIVMPVNEAESQLLEGTKMCIDDIKKIDQFKDWTPGRPSKILYLKNIAPCVTQEQLSLLYNQFVHANGRPIDVRLMTGRMRGQAFVTFETEDIAIQAQQETHGTIVSGRPLISQFSRNTNRLQDDIR